MRKYTGKREHKKSHKLRNSIILTALAGLFIFGMTKCYFDKRAKEDREKRIEIMREEALKKFRDKFKDFDDLNPSFTPQPSMGPIVTPSAEPSVTGIPSPSPAPSATSHPSATPVTRPTSSPTLIVSPSTVPSASPSVTGIPSPSAAPIATPHPSATPSPSPSASPSPAPSASTSPSAAPSASPSATPPVDISLISPSPSPSPAPSAKPTPAPTPRPHYHSFGEWYSINDEEEQRKCSCGKVEKRAHKYEVISTSKGTSNKNGTHRIVITKECVNCKHKINEAKTIDCTYGSLQHDEDHEYKLCTECGYELNLGAHKFKVISTSNAKSNKNGTHSVTVTKECTSCKYKFSETKTIDCTYGSLLFDKDHEYKLCTECGYELDLGGHTLETEVSYEAADGKHHTVITDIHCTTCDYKDSNRERESCTTNGGLIWHNNDENEYKECEHCHQEVIVGTHSYGKPENNEAGFKVESCTHTGCGYEKAHHHQAELTPGDYTSIDDSYHYEITSCETCGDVLLREKTEHSYYTDFDDPTMGKIEICSDCGHRKETYYPQPDPDPEEDIIDLSLGTFASTNNEVYTLVRKLY